MPYLDKEQKFYDYRTAEVDGDNIFDTRKASNSDAQQILNGDPYWKNEKNTYSEIVYMSPKEYFTRCAEDCFNESFDKLVASRRRDSNTNEHLKQVLLKYKKRFPLPYIDYATHHTPSQEGLHRMMVAGDLFGWDKKFPVQIIKWVDQDRAAQEKEWKHKREIERYLSRAIDRALRYKYYNLEELKDQLYSEFEQEVRYVDEFENRVFKLDLVDSGDKEDPGLLAIIDNKYESIIRHDEIQLIPKSDKEDMSDSDIDDLSDEDMSDWLKDLLHESFDAQASFLTSKNLIDELKANFGHDFNCKPVCKEVCEYIEFKYPQYKNCTHSVTVWKLGESEIYPISTNGHCIIGYNNQVYDYTSSQYDNYGFKSSSQLPRVLEYSPELSSTFGTSVYKDNDYLISI